MTIEMLQNVKKYGVYALLLGGILITSCDDDDPEPENEVEVVTDVTLVFTNTADASDVVRASAEDPDGEGVQELQIQDDITLTSGATYTLTFEIFNNLETPGEDIGEEIEEEDDEHQFFFSFTDGAFSDPSGNGNRDNASDPINYEDEDSDGQDGTGNPVGLETTWTAGDALTDGSFRVTLKHQPDVKTSTSDVNDGDTDWDLTFVLNIE